MPQRFCAKENEAAGIALMRSDMGVYWQVSAWHRQAMRVTAAHGRFGAIVAVRHTITALAAVDLVDVRAERRGWSPYPSPPLPQALNRGQ